METPDSKILSGPREITSAPTGWVAGRRGDAGEGGGGDKGRRREGEGGRTKTIINSPVCQACFFKRQADEITTWCRVHHPPATPTSLSAQATLHSYARSERRHNSSWISTALPSHTETRGSLQRYHVRTMMSGYFPPSPWALWSVFRPLCEPGRRDTGGQRVDSGV